MAGLLDVKGDGQLQGIESPEAIRHSVLTQEAPGAMEMKFVNRWPNQKALLSKIGTKTPPCYFERRQIDLLVLVLIASTDSNSTIDR